MTKELTKYIENINKYYSLGYKGEETYRIVVSQLFNDVDPEVLVVNEPGTSYGKSRDKVDMVVCKDECEVCFIETKSIGSNLRKLSKNFDQIRRYVERFPNFIYTNYLDWEFYRDSELKRKLTVGKIKNNSIELTADIDDSLNGNDILLRMLKDFFELEAKKISDPLILARKLAKNAHIAKDAMLISMKNHENSPLNGQYMKFKKYFFNNISKEYFVDFYAETIMYGLLAAKLNHNENSIFNIRNVTRFVPASIPLLKSLFSVITSGKLDGDVKLAIEKMIKVLQNCDLKEVLKGLGGHNDHFDSIVHFYETFQDEYNPQKKKDLGVYCTPNSIVKFIVKSVDDILRRDFGLKNGLADTTQTSSRLSKKSVDKVQILDPAVGSGSFLLEVIRIIINQTKDDISTINLREEFVRNQLLPKIHGFELLMAPYIICHLSLLLNLKEEFGIDFGKSKSDRLSIYLTNSLKENVLDQEIPQLLKLGKVEMEEMNGVNYIKEECPIFCIIGNPPYHERVESPDKDNSPKIHELLKSYKQEPPDSDGFRAKLNEKNSKSLNDLYVQFFRVSSDWIEKNGEGILAFITNNGFISNSTFHGMRWHLLHTFDKIWILNLHGKKSDSEDENVFNITLGVSIIIAVKKKASSDLATLKQRDLIGSRSKKFSELDNCSVYDKNFTEYSPLPPKFILSPKDQSVLDKYNKGFEINKFMYGTTATTTAADELSTNISKEKLAEKLKELKKLNKDEFQRYCTERLKTKDFKFDTAYQEIQNLDMSNIKNIVYRPFDLRWIYFTGKSGLVSRPREIMKHMNIKENVALVFARQSSCPEKPTHVFVTDSIFNCRGIWDTDAVAKVAPIYLRNDGKIPKYLKKSDSENSYKSHKIVNFHPDLLLELQNIVNSANEKHIIEPLDEFAVFDYIYGTLNCPKYLEYFADFLREEHPRIPFPNSPSEFWHISQNGRQLRLLHLMKESSIGKLVDKFQFNNGSRVVENNYPKLTDQGNVLINEKSYFENVGEEIYNTIIAGYKPADRWLMDRRGMKLSDHDIRHYNKILKILDETNRITESICMKIDL